MKGDVQTIDAPMARAPRSSIPLHHTPHDEGIVHVLHEHHAAMLQPAKERADGSIRLHNYKNTYAAVPPLGSPPTLTSYAPAANSKARCRWGLHHRILPSSSTLVLPTSGCRTATALQALRRAPHFWDVPDLTLDCDPPVGCSRHNTFDRDKSSTYSADGRPVHVKYGSGFINGYLGAYPRLSQRC